LLPPRPPGALSRTFRRTRSRPQWNPPRRQSSSRTSRRNDGCRQYTATWLEYQDGSGSSSPRSPHVVMQPHSEHRVNPPAVLCSRKGKDIVSEADEDAHFCLRGRIGERSGQGETAVWDCFVTAVRVCPTAGNSRGFVGRSERSRGRKRGDEPPRAWKAKECCLLMAGTTGRLGVGRTDGGVEGLTTPDFPGACQMKPGMDLSVREGQGGAFGELRMGGCDRPLFRAACPSAGQA
jgi:hypothetical protein